MMSRTLAWMAAASLVFGTAGPALAKKKRPMPRYHEAAVAVSRAWVRMVPQGAEGMPAYMVLTNPAKRGLVLYGARSPHFADVQVHVLRHTGEKVGLDWVDQIGLPGHGSLVFKPGNSQLLLMKPRRRFKTGDTIPLVLDFGQDGRRSLLLRVMQDGR